MRKQNNRIGLKGLGTGFVKTKNWATTLACTVAMLGLSVMAVTVTMDVILRYVFNAPTKWVGEVAGYLLVTVVLMGLAHTQRERGHIRVDILVSRLPRKVRPWAELLMLVMSFALTVILLYLSVGEFMLSVKLRSTSESVMAFPLAPWQAFIPLGLTILALMLIWAIYTEVGKVRRREYEPEEASELPQEDL